MPGLRYLGPTLTNTHGTYPLLYNQDVYMPNTTTDNTQWDYPVDLNAHIQSPAVEALPYVPNKHKPCRPPQLHAAWMKRKSEGSHSDLFSSKSRSSMSASAPELQSNGSGPDTDDLAAMVHDFIEEGSADFFDGSDSDGGPPSIEKLCETLQVLTTSHGAPEREIFHVVRKHILAINVDTDLVCYAEGAECKGGCAKRLIAKRLQAEGYDAAVCKSLSLSSGRLIGGAMQAGEYEYIDVEFKDPHLPDRLIVDIDFQDHFELARPTPEYTAALKLLPTVLVGTPKMLKQMLTIMSDAAKLSLKENSMPLPPWRTLDFMTSKWLSPHERIEDRVLLSPYRGFRSPNFKAKLPTTPETCVCSVQIRRTKESLVGEVKGSKLNAAVGWGKPRPHPNSRVKRSIPWNL